MSLNLHLRRRLRDAAAPALGLLLVGYFAYHAIQGDRGVFAWMQLSQQISQARATLAETSEQRRALEHRASLLRPESLDPDLLEEQARRELGLVHPDERVILTPRH